MVLAPIIHTEKLRKVYAVGKERVIALNNVDLSIEKGEFCCIVGQSGSGKSTLLNQLAGLEKPTSGKVFIGRHEISAMTENELAAFRQQHLGFIFQSYNLLPTMTAAENVALPLMFKGVDKKTRLARARKELKAMGLLGRANHLPTEMSGGQQQRVGIARAFVSSPKVIFADEPTGNLDSRTSKQVLYRMLELSKNNHVTFVMVTHEPELAECADRIVTILDGKVCSNVLQDEETKKKNRDALFADLEGDLDIGGEAAKEQPAKKPSPKGEGARRADEGQCSRSNPAKEEYRQACPSSVTFGDSFPLRGSLLGDAYVKKFGGTTLETTIHLTYRPDAGDGALRTGAGGRCRRDRPDARPDAHPDCLHRHEQLGRRLCVGLHRHQRSRRRGHDR